MKKEQIDLMIKKQEAIDNREKIANKLSKMLNDAKNINLTHRYYDIILDDSLNLGLVSNKQEFIEQLEFLVAYHRVKLEEQIKEMETYILSKKVD